MIKKRGILISSQKNKPECGKIKVNYIKSYLFGEGDWAHCNYPLIFNDVKIGEIDIPVVHTPEVNNIIPKILKSLFNTIIKFANTPEEEIEKLFDSSDKNENNTEQQIKPINVTENTKDIPSQIKQIKELLDLGILTDEEYNEKKKGLLSKM